MSKVAAKKYTNQLLDKADNTLNGITIFAEKNLTNPKKNKDNLVDFDKVDNALKNDFPLFYNAYISVQKNDPLVKKIIFGYKENPKSICTASSKNGTIFFNLYFFENGKIKEDRAIFELFQMLGYLHKKPQSNGVNNKVQNNVTASGFALTSTKDFAKSNNCEPLKYAIGVINKRVAQSESKESDKNEACLIVSKGVLFQECISYVETQCK